MKILLIYLLPFLVPLAFFMLYAWWANRRIEDGKEITLGGNWYWVVVSGFVLMIASMITWKQISGEAPGAVYTPPKLVDGVIVPGHFTRPDDPDNSPGTAPETTKD